MPLSTVITTPFIDKMLTFLLLLSKLQFPPLYGCNFEVYFGCTGAFFFTDEIVAILTLDEQCAFILAPIYTKNQIIVLSLSVNVLIEAQTDITSHT